MVIEEEGSIPILSNANIKNEEKKVQKLKSLADEAEASRKRLALPKSTIKSQQNVLSSRTAQSKDVNKNRGPKINTGGTAPVIRKNRLQENSSRIDQLEKDLKETKSKFDEVLGFNLQNTLLDMFKLGVPFAIGSKIAEFVWDRIQKEFGPGGRFDVRKIVKDQVREFLKLEILIARDRGEVFFGTSDGLTQGPPQFSNTERLQDGRSRDIQRNMGY